MSFTPKKFRVKKVSRVALVDEGANLTPGIQKAKKGEALTITPILKASGDQGLLYGLVFAANIVDAHGHFMLPEDVQAACHTFGESGMQMDVMHGDEVLAKSRAAVVESMILRDTDDRFPQVDHLGRDIPHQGAWAMVVKRHDSSLKDLNELSLMCEAGDYFLEDPSEEELAVLKQKDPNPEAALEADDDMADAKIDYDAIGKSVGNAIAESLPKTIKSAMDESLKPLLEEQAKRKEAEEAEAERKRKEAEDKKESPVAKMRRERAEKGKEIAVARLLKKFELDSLESAVELDDDEYDEFETALKAIDSPERKKRRGSARKHTSGGAPSTVGILSTGNSADDEELDAYLKSKHESGNKQRMGRIGHLSR